jgi:hypothetical protein
MYLEIDLSISLRNDIGIFMGVILNLYVAFSNIAIFPILILSVHENGSYFHFLVSQKMGSLGRWHLIINT